MQRTNTNCWKPSDKKSSPNSLGIPSSELPPKIWQRYIYTPTLIELNTAKSPKNNFNFQNLKLIVLHAQKLFLRSEKRFGKVMIRIFGIFKKYLVTTTHPPPTSKMLLAVRFSKKSTRGDFKAMYLAVECRNRLENLTNRKLTIFYIETMSRLFFQLRKQKSFSDHKKKSRFFRSKIFSKKIL